MSLPASTVLSALRKGELLPPEQLLEAERLAATTASGDDLVAALLARGWLTAYQAAELSEGRSASLVVGSYVLLEKLGEGGMGEVFKARHKVMDRQVALKRILAKYLDSSAAVERFQREVRAAALLSHPNVVQVHDAGEANGIRYLAMELLRGVSLANYLERRGQLPVAEALDYVKQACEGMQHAHERGLVHRDLKPGNLWLTQQRQIKILDMGLALVAAATTLTQVGGSFGTVDYIAPEQVQDSHRVDIRADVYSLGCTLYHLLAGSTPFAETHPAARPAMHLSQEPPPIERRRPDVPAGVVAVVRRMMAKRPEDRYQTPGEAAAALGFLLRCGGDTVPPEQAPYQPTEVVPVAEARLVPEVEPVVEVVETPHRPAPRRRSSFDEQGAPRRSHAPQVQGPPADNRLILWIAAGCLLALDVGFSELVLAILHGANRPPTRFETYGTFLPTPLALAAFGCLWGRTGWRSRWRAFFISVAFIEGGAVAVGAVWGLVAGLLAIDPSEEATRQFVRVAFAPVILGVLNFILGLPSALLTATFVSVRVPPLSD